MDLSTAIAKKTPSPLAGSEFVCVCGLTGYMRDVQRIGG